MGRFTAVVLCCIFAGAGPSFAAVESGFPYKAVVVSDQLYVRSGPGQEYYPTGRLRRGQEVEVFRHEQTGWCAIRPPKGSFAWISGRSLNLKANGLAVVVEEGASARVGSPMSDVRDVEQVRLHKGEVVEILEMPPPARQNAAAAGRDHSNDGPWFKIAPPSGEFRWVYAQFLEPVRDAESPAGGAVKRQDAASTLRAALGDDSAGVAPAQTAARPRPHAGPARPRTLSTAEFQDELDRINLELSVMVIEEPTVWALDLLRDQTDELLDQAATPEERSRARQIAGQIARFADIKRRQADVLAMCEPAVTSDRLLARLLPSDPAPEKARPQFETDGRFDGVGRLAEIPSAKPGAPHFALTNQTGEVLCYVTAAPGVNLRNYLGREVGVVGSRGYIPEQHAAHIVARHIAPLDGQNLLR